VRFAGVEYEIQAIFNEGDIGLILLHKPVTGIRADLSVSLER